MACLVSREFESFLGSSASETSKSELLIYLDEANHPLNDKNFNLLHYWKVNALRFHVVSTMAKKFLAVPASNVSSESTFSCGGRVLDNYRSSLKPATVQALVCASSGYEVLKVLLLFWYVIFSLFCNFNSPQVCVYKYVILNSCWYREKLMMVTLRPWSFPAVWWRATSEDVETHHGVVHLLALAMPHGCF
jgi:hypothetical protein